MISPLALAPFNPYGVGVPHYGPRVSPAAIHIQPLQGCFF